MKNVNKKIDGILREMTQNGFLINKTYLDSLEKEISKEISSLISKIYQKIDFEINLNSSQQIADLLFNKLKLPVIKKTKTGFSTEEKVLTKLKSLHPLVLLIIEYRYLSKIKSTYISGLKKFISRDNRIHANFLSDIALTGRVVSRNPNLQSIPIRSDWGKRLRQAFIVPQGEVLLSADYSQVDLRILAHLSKEPKLIKAFQDNQDIHLKTACEIFSKKESEITTDDRRVAKTVNFGIIYGISPYGLAESLEIDPKQATYLIKTYFQTYPRVKFFIDDLKEKAVKNGYTETLGGEKRYIKELESEKSYLKHSGERMAVNYPIQGTAAEIIKLAMIEIQNIIHKKNLRVMPLLQIHDELLFEVSEDDLKIFIPILKASMERVVSLDVPLIVDIEKGYNWGEMEEILS